MGKNLSKFMLFMIAGVLAISTIIFSNPGTSSAASTTYKTTDSLNVRIGPGVKYSKVATLKKGTVVTKVKSSGNWMQVKYNTSKVGWVNAKYLKAVTTVTATAPAKTTYYYVTEPTGLNMRASYSVTAKKVGVTVPYGAKVKIKKVAKNGWIQVTYGGKTGWISADEVYGFKSTTNITFTASAPSELTYVLVHDDMNVRSLPSTVAPKLGTVTEGYAARILRVSNTNWAEVQYSDSQKGWISLKTSDTSTTTEEPQQVSEPVSASLSGIKIVVDAGHGGSDPGAVGKDLNGNKISEATLALKSAQVLKAKIESLGGTVYMTRSGSGALSSNKKTDLGLRAKEAAKKGANAFISIHYNSAVSTAQGVETLYYQSTSKKFANTIHENMIDAIQEEYPSVKDRKLKYQNVMVLRENSVFATLVELGFMSNPTELSRVNTDKYRQTVAEGITNGIIEFYGRD
ncbi:N-acetylmuramoyl-L-alanine amidase [Kurthia massiliensis]|uniref:N-acetylmuramoyl-L-alanine amidase n=1 Tax=Kurthia massiliensis TaxID=1033739 RepID=UPI000287D1EC|nr:N-acetylmuramoyl-L-alanine amidase [Kurthia massiliensis]